MHFTKGETNLLLTQPLWRSIKPNTLRTIRLAIALINTICAIFDASYTGWKPYFWYLADWCLFLTLLTQWGLIAVHFFPF
jgi:hypothetical protein